MSTSKFIQVPILGKIRIQSRTVHELKRAIRHFHGAKAAVNEIFKRKLLAQDYFKIKKSISMTVVRSSIAYNRKKPYAAEIANSSSNLPPKSSKDKTQHN